MPHALKRLPLVLLAMLFAAALVAQRFEARTTLAADDGGGDAPQAFSGSFADYLGPTLVGPTAVGLSDPVDGLFVGERIEIVGAHEGDAAIEVDGVVVPFESLLSSSGESEDRRGKIFEATPYGDGALYVGHSSGTVGTPQSAYWLGASSVHHPLSKGQPNSGILFGVAGDGTFVGTAGGTIAAYGNPTTNALQVFVGFDSTVVWEISADSTYVAGGSFLWVKNALGGYDVFSTAGFDFSQSNDFAPDWRGVETDAEGNPYFAGVFFNLTTFGEEVGFWDVDGEFLGSFGHEFADFAVGPDGEVIAAVNDLEDGYLVRMRTGESLSVESLVGRKATFAEKGLFAAEGKLGLLLEEPGGAFYTVLQTAGADPPNGAPTATALLPKTVECVAGQHLVTLSTTANDADGDSLTVTWKVDGRVEKEQSGVAPGTTVSFDFAYPHGVHQVAVEASDGIDTTVSRTTVTVQDTAAPIVIVAADVRVRTDRGKLFATKVVLTTPTASDASGHPVTLTADAPARYRLGDTVVTWTATDEAGNQANATQMVTVVNRRPKANAGKNVTIATTSERGARVTLDGSRSSDPDEHNLKYAWRAKGVKLAPNRLPKASGIFPVGTTVVSLTVTDAAGARHRDTVRVIVKLKNAKRRPRGSDANRSFAAASQQARAAAETKSSTGSTLSGLAYANAAAAYGDAAGDHVRWEEGKSEEAAALRYAELRALQRAYGQAAASSLLAAYAETGDERLLAAYRYAAYGNAYATADLSEK
ncbi:MAG TPA: HYR domain-containing protein [Pirellulaceae bacterium]|jgi:hypothetical protein|nr:HYR domain-containing protein [Pirellulaceae bacterium]